MDERVIIRNSTCIVINPEEEINVDENYLTIINTTAYSIQNAIFHYIDGIGGITIPELSLEDSLTALTQALAMALANSENRTILFNQLTQSGDEEHKFLTTDYLRASTSNGYTVLHSLSISSGYCKDYLQNFAQNHPDWTIYFPVKKHYADWIRNKGNSAPMTAYDPLIDEEYVESITSYQKDGAVSILSAQTIPIEPTLVVSSECFDYYLPDTIEMPGSSTYWINVDSSHLYNDHEPWYRGASEIYINAYRYSSNIPQHTEFNSGNWNVDLECVKYPRPGYPAPSRNIWSSNNYKCNKIKIMESD